MLLRLWPFVRPRHAPRGVAGRCSSSPRCWRSCARSSCATRLDAFDTPGGHRCASRDSGHVARGHHARCEQALAFPQLYPMQLAGARAMADLRVRRLQLPAHPPPRVLRPTPVGRLVTRVTNDVDAIGEMFASGALNAFGDLIRLGVIVAMMLLARLAACRCSPSPRCPLSRSASTGRARRMRDAFREVRAKTAQDERLPQRAGLRAWPSCRPTPGRSARPRSSTRSTPAYRNANNRSIVLDATLDAAIEMVSSVCIAAVLWYAGVNSLSDEISFGTLVRASSPTSTMFFVPIRDLSARYTLLAVRDGRRGAGLRAARQQGRGRRRRRRARGARRGRRTRASRSSSTTSASATSRARRAPRRLDRGEARREGGAGRRDRRRQEHRGVAAAPRSTTSMRAWCGSSAATSRAYARDELRRQLRRRPPGRVPVPGHGAHQHRGRRRDRRSRRRW